MVALCTAIIYTFRDSAVPIYEELRKTPLWAILLMCISACAYEFVEGWITYSFAKTYNPKFTYWQGLESAFYCCFYRVATLGSGAGIAAIYYFHEKGIEYSQGTGMYTIEYMIHKVSIAIFSVILIFINWRFILGNFGSYRIALIVGFCLTGLITGLLLLVCCSERVHKCIIWILKKINHNGKIDFYVSYIMHEIDIFETASRDLLGRKSKIICAVLKNILKLTFWYGIPFLSLVGKYDVTFLQVLAVTSISVMLAAVIPAPAGIGSTEVVFVMLFALLVGTGRAGSISLLYRFTTFVFPFLIGTVVVIIQKRAGRKIVVVEKE